MKLYRVMFILFLISFASTVGAHDFSKNGTASLLVHIEPGEVAVAGKAITIQINLENSEPGFSLEKCDCRLTIEQNGKKEFVAGLTAALGGGEFNIKDVPFTFESDGEYRLDVDAEPNGSNFFTPFKIELPLKVLPAGTALPQGKVATTHLEEHGNARAELAGAIIFSMVMAFFLFTNNRHDTNSMPPL